jgi:manganese transport protein
MDPGNWATDLAGGSRFGFSLLWVLLMSNGMALLLQSLSARLGIVRGLDLAQASRATFPKAINLALYVLAEIAIAACDLAEVLGMAIALNLLFGLPLLTGVLITALDSFILLFLLQVGIRKMEAFIVSLVALIGICFFAQLWMAKPDVGEAVKGFVPSLQGSEALYIAIGIIGATVMPHNLYLHSSLVQTRRIAGGEKALKQAIRFNFLDSAVALNLAFFVNAAILVLAATVFHKMGHQDVAEIQDAHRLLEPLLGSSWAPILFGVALLASGQSSTITGTLAGQVVMEGYLHLRIQPWARRLITRLLAIVPAVITLLVYGEHATGKLLVFSQVILSMQLGFAVIPLIHFVSDRKTMGIFTAGLWVRVLAWISATVIVSLNLGLVLNAFLKGVESATHSWVWWGLVFPLMLIGIMLLLYVILHPWLPKLKPQGTGLIHSDVLPPADLVAEGQKWNRIAVCLDFSESDPRALRRALGVGGKSADYILIHVSESPGALILGKEVEDQEATLDRKMLAEWQSTLESKGYRVEVSLGFGNPKFTIPELVTQAEAGVLVMAAHGHRGWRDWLLGTTLDGVRHRISIPLLIV